MVRFWRDGPLVWRAGGSRTAYVLFGLQLALNLAWSVLFFYLRSPLLGLVDIVALWLAVAATLWVFSKYSRPAGLLLVLYLAWVSFAGALNAAIWALN